MCVWLEGYKINQETIFIIRSSQSWIIIILSVYKWEKEKIENIGGWSSLVKDNLWPVMQYDPELGERVWRVCNTSFSFNTERVSNISWFFPPTLDYGLLWTSAASEHIQLSYHVLAENIEHHSPVYEGTGLIFLDGQVIGKKSVSYIKAQNSEPADLIYFRENISTSCFTYGLHQWN